MFDGNDIDTITHAGIIFLVYLSLMIMFYFLFGGAVDVIFDAFTGTSFGYANEEMALYVPLYRTAVKMVFAIGLAAPITWFIFWSFSKEPVYTKIKYR